MIKLNNRLKAISDLTSSHLSYLDIGCDHALLDIYLCNEYKNLKVIASDIHEGALKGAEKNIEKCSIEGTPQQQADELYALIRRIKLV